MLEIVARTASRIGGRTLVGASMIAASISMAAAQDMTTIGSILPHTGNLAWYGQEIGRGYDLAVSKINADGGIDGKKIELLHSDAPQPAAPWVKWSV